jgi:hypothetical protein
MRTRQSFGRWILLVAAAVIGTTGMTAAPAARQSAVTYLDAPTLIGSTFVVGPVLFTHDNGAMARGEPCTSVHLFDPATHRATEEIAAFQCIPRRGEVVSRLTITTRPSPFGYGCVLTSYQFAGDREVHGVPEQADVN